MQRKKVVITGASGCVGHYLVEEFLNNPSFDIVLYIKHPDKLRSDLRLHPAVTIVEGAMEDVEQHCDLFGKCNILVHPAASWLRDGAESVNLIYTRKMLELVDHKYCERIIYFSTASILGNDNQLLPEALTHGSDYVRTKAEMYRLLPYLAVQEKVITIFPTIIFGGDNRHPYSHITGGLKQMRKVLSLLGLFYIEGSFHYIHAEDISKLCRYIAETSQADLKKLSVNHGISPLGITGFVPGNPAVTYHEVLKAFTRTQRAWVRPVIKLPVGGILDLAKLFRFRIDRWGEFCLRYQNFTYKTLSCAQAGLASRYASLAEILDFKHM